MIASTRNVLRQAKSNQKQSREKPTKTKSNQNQSQADQKVLTITQTATDPLPLPNNRRDLLQGGKCPLLVARRIFETLDDGRDGFGGVVGFFVGQGGVVAVEGR